MEILNQQELNLDILNLIHNKEELEKLEKLGEGINSNTFRFRDKFCLKVYKENAFETKDGDILSSLNSVNVPKCYSYVNGIYCLTELVEGKTIANIDSDHRYILKTFNKQIGNFKEHLFANEFQVKDLHLNNIMISNDGVLKVVDLGRFQKSNNLENPLKYHLFRSSSSTSDRSSNNRRSPYYVDSDGNFYTSSEYHQYFRN